MWKSDHLESVDHCGLCGSKQSKQLAVRPDNLPIHECLDCGFAYLGVRPNSGALSDYYNSGYFQDSQTYDDYFNYAQAIYDLKYCPRLHRLSPFLSEWKGKRVLDIGCAAAGTLALLKQEGAIVTGIEISEEACQVALDQFGLHLINDSLDYIQLPEETYDVVMMFDVLEHLENPGNALEKVERLLVKEGTLAITVPNFDRFFVEGLKWAGLQAYWEHLNYFRGDILRNRLLHMGFDIIETHSYTAGLTQQGTPERGTIRVFLGNLRKRFRFLAPSMRLARKLRFMIVGPPMINVFYENQGMDLFVLAKKCR